MTKYNTHLATKKCLLGFILPVVMASSVGMAAENGCHTFRLQDDELVFDQSVAGFESASLDALLEAISDDQQLVVDFAANELCLAPAGVGLDRASAANYRINANQQELAVEAMIDGSVDLWLRISPAYESELLLVREIGEAIGLADMEFLSDNSGVGAEDFFAEQLLILEIGGFEIDAPFAEVPRFGVTYNHYQEGGGPSTAGAISTQGTLGYESLRNLTLSFSPSQSLVLIAR